MFFARTARFALAALWLLRPASLLWSRSCSFMVLPEPVGLAGLSPCPSAVKKLVNFTVEPLSLASWYLHADTRALERASLLVGVSGWRF